MRLARRAAVVLAAALLLTGCEQVGRIGVAYEPGQSLALALPGCFDGARIHSAQLVQLGQLNQTPVVWRVESTDPAGTTATVLSVTGDNAGFVTTKQLSISELEGPLSTVTLGEEIDASKAAPNSVGFKVQRLPRDGQVADIEPSETKLVADAATFRAKTASCSGSSSLSFVPVAAGGLALLAAAGVALIGVRKRRARPGREAPAVS
jgi:hypothetical protein